MFDVVCILQQDYEPWIPAHFACELENVLVQYKNLLVLDERMGLGKGSE